MTKPILIVGGGPAGLAAAHALSSIGRPSVLVEKTSILGGAPIQSGYAKLVPSGRWATDAIGGMVARVEGDAAVTRKLGTTVSRFSGDPGSFVVELSDGSRVEVGAVVLATGFTHFDSVNKPEWGFGLFPDVVTTTQVEQMFSSGQGVRCPSDGRAPKRVAILLCVGSRDRQIGREWCSKICCTVSANLAMEIREALPDCHVYIYYMDIRTYGHDLTHDLKSVEVVDRLSTKAGHKAYKAGEAETIHALDWLKETIGEEGLRERTRGKLAGLRIANYYGCMYVRPRHIFPEKDKGPGSESTNQPHFHGRPARRGRRRERELPAQDRVLRRFPHALGQRHVDEARTQHPPGR